MRRPSFARAATPALVLGLLAAAPAAVAGDPAYRKPPAAIEAVLEAPAFPKAFVSPTHDVLLLATPLRMPPVADLARPMLRLAGLRIDPATNGVHHAPSFSAFEAVRVADGSHVRIALPNGTRASAPAWSPDGRRFAFASPGADGTDLWVGNAATGNVERLDGIRLNALFGDAVAWLPDGETILAHVLATDRGAPPAAPAVAEGPVVQESSGVRAATATYEDLLADAHDEALFAYYASGRYALVDTRTRARRDISPNGLYARAHASPDGRYVAFDRIHAPFSYHVPWYAFPHQTVVVDAGGREVRALADVPLQERIAGDDDGALGPHDATWQPSSPATLLWIESQPRARDAAYALDVTRAGPPHPLVALSGVFRGFDFVAGSERAFVRDYDRDARVTRTLELDLSRDNDSPATVGTLRDGDLYRDPGRPLTSLAPNGESVATLDGDAVFLYGDGYSSAGRRPFVDRLDLRTHEKRRIFQSALEPLERVVAVLDTRGETFLVQRESPTQPPDFYVARLDAHDVRALTHFVDPTPQIRAISKRIVTYRRADGVECSFALYLPPNYREGTRLPTLLWAYPYEFNDATVAGQQTNFAQGFDAIAGDSPVLAALAGYAVLDNVSMPVVGDPKTVNDTFLDQVSADARAAIDRAVAIGVTDRSRVAIGGHSYGAFMAANLLAHTTLFRAGIAESGAYNRTLTPFGFQNERRTFWDAPELYEKLSPFAFARSITAPLLLVHGMADDNAGTFPLQSERMYAAIRGNGGIARLVMLPYEAHGYLGRESIETTAAEEIDWLDRYLRGAGSSPPNG